MPIEVSNGIQACDQEEFHAFDRRIMGVVFDIHNEFGRLLNEDLFKCEIAARCVSLGIPAEREVRIRVTREALVYFLGGLESVYKAVELFSGPRRLGVQNLNLLTEDIGFAFTTLPQNAGAMREHLDRLLNHTRLKAIQWINLNRHVVEFVTLLNTKA